MLTAGDVQFAPQQSKIHWVTSSIVAMISGDIALAVDLLTGVREIVNDRIRREPRNWWNVVDVAGLWRDAHAERSRRTAELRLLVPLGLTIETFISQQQQLSPDLVDKISRDLVNFELPTTELILCGIDQSGPHIYVAHGAKIESRDAIGFAAVGCGSYHARSQLMFSGHVATDKSSKAIYYAYAAKKRAEVAPGVGNDTDTVIIWGLGQSAPLRQEIIDSVAEAYEESTRETARIASEAEKKVEESILQFTSGPPTETQDPPKPADGAATAGD